MRGLAREHRRLRDVNQELREERAQIAAQAQDIRNMSGRISELRARSLGVSETVRRATRDAGAVSEAADALALRDEELAVTLEELRAQNDQLVDAHQLLERERAQYLDLFEDAPDAYFVTDKQGYVRDANRAAGALFRVPQRVFAGKSLVHFVARQDTRAFRRFALVAAATPGVSKAELRMRPRGGATFAAAVAVRPVLAPGGAVVALRWIVRTTEAESEHGPIAALEGKLAERDRAVVEIAGQRDEAREASDERDDWIAAVSHEMRSPVQSILGWVRLLRREGATQADRARAIDALERAAILQGGLMDDLLGVVRLQVGKFELQLSDIDLAELARSAVGSLYPLWRTKDLRAEVAGEAGECLVRGDATRLHQVITNLVGNAIKFTPRGGRIDVAVRHEGPSAILAVHDSGTGIAPDLLTHVFDRYRQAEKAYAHAGAGIGLGLYLVHELVALHGGSVHAESEGEGQGSTFTVVLPALGVAR